MFPSEIGMKKKRCAIVLGIVGNVYNLIGGGKHHTALIENRNNPLRRSRSCRLQISLKDVVESNTKVPGRLSRSMFMAVLSARLTSGCSGLSSPSKRCNAGMDNSDRSVVFLFHVCKFNA